MGENARVCQFFLRGRCQRQKCEFRHPAELEKEKRPNGTDRPSGHSERETCKFFLSTGCKFGANCHFKHVGRDRDRDRRRSRSRSRERRYRYDSDDDRKGDSSDDEHERRKRERKRREEKEKEYQRRKLKVEEREKDKKCKDSKTTHEKKEKTCEKRSLLLKRTSIKEEDGGSRQKSRSPSKKSVKSGSESQQSSATSKPEESQKLSEFEPKPSTNAMLPTEPRCSKCGQKVVKRRATS